MKVDVEPRDEDGDGVDFENQVSMDEALEICGSLGKVQLILQLFFMSVISICFYQSVGSVFTGDSPSWTCKNSTSSPFCRHNYGVEIKNTHTNFSHRCVLQRTEWRYTTAKSYSYVTEFDLVCERNTLAALTGGVFFIGIVISAIVCGTTSDMYGRKKTFLLFLILATSCSIGSSFVRNIWGLIILRFLVGLGSSAGWGLSFVYLAEFIPPRRRTICINLANIAFPLGSFFIAGIAYVERNWRQLQLYVSLPGIIAVLACLFVPESPYWLMATGKRREAEKVIRKIAHMNGKVLGNDIKLKELNSKKCDDVTVDKKKYTYIDLCRHTKVAFLVLALCVLWFTLALCYFTTTFQVSNLGGNIYSSFILISLPDIPSCFLPVYLCDHFGRKKTILVSCVISGVISSLIAIITMQLSSVYLVNIILSFCGKLLLNTAYNGICLWQFELYPTVLRSQGTSVGMVAENLGSAAAPFLSEVLHDISAALPYIVMGVLGILSPLLGLILPETNKCPTRERYEDFFCGKKETDHASKRNTDEI